MADLAAAKRYAQAAFDLARQSGQDLARWRAELGDVATVLAESGAAFLFADSRIPAERRFALVERALDVQPLVLNLAKLLVAKGRSGDARAVSDAFGRLVDDDAGIAHAHVTTAVDIAPERLQAVEAQISRSIGRRVLATSATDPAIIGGVVVRVGDRLIDGSVRTRLRRLRRELSGAR